MGLRCMLRQDMAWIFDACKDKTWPMPTIERFEFYFFAFLELARSIDVSSTSTQHPELVYFDLM